MSRSYYARMGFGFTVSRDTASRQVGYPFYPDYIEEEYPQLEGLPYAFYDQIAVVTKTSARNLGGDVTLRSSAEYGAVFSVDEVSAMVPNEEEMEQLRAAAKAYLPEGEVPEFGIFVGVCIN